MRQRDPSIKFPGGTNIKPISTSGSSNQQSFTKANYQPSPYKIKDPSSLKHKLMNKITSVRFPSGIRNKPPVQNSSLSSSGLKSEDFNSNSKYGKKNMIQNSELSSKQSSTGYHSRLANSSYSNKYFDSNKSSTSLEYSAAKTGTYTNRDGKNVIPILPSRATPSNFRCKSETNRDVFISNKAKLEINPLPKTGYYASIRDRTPLSSTRPDETSHRSSYNTARSVDHVRDYMKKKKLKDEIFAHIESHGNIIEFEKFLRISNPDINCRNDSWKTPLHVAAENNMSTAWFNVLIRYGADINRMTPDNKTALHYV